MPSDPAFLYWNDRKKFNKFIKRVTGPAQEEGDEDNEEE